MVKDYNSFCKSYDDGNTLSRTAWQGISETMGIESPSDWGMWIKWTIKKQALAL